MMKIDTTEIDRAVELLKFIQSGMARSLRQQAKLSLTVVARTVGAHPSAVAHWEKGERRPTGVAAQRYLELLKRLAKAQS